MPPLSNEDKNRTVRFIDGKWRYENDGTVINIALEKFGDISIKIEQPDEETIEKTFSANAHWFGDFLCFVYDNSPYYLRYADENEMIFGEWVTAGLIADRKWEYFFQRIE